MNTLSELKKHKALLESQIADAMKKERKEAIAQVRTLVEAFELNEKEVFKTKDKRKSQKIAAAKYKDKVTGKTWSGRGRTPVWLVGKNKDDYAI